MMSEKSLPSSVLTLTFSLGLIGCGGGETASSPEAASAAQAMQQSSAPTDTPATATTAAAEKQHARDEVWVDDKGQKWFGKVPMDAFFDKPYEVATNTAPIAGASQAVASAEPAMESASADSAAATETETPQPAPASTTPAPEKPTESATTETAAADSWDALIPVAVLDEEIKNIRNFLQETVSSVGNYNSSMMMIPPKVATLAALAEVAHLQGQSVSWKDDAIYIRDLAGKMNSSPLQRGAKDQKRLQELFESIADILNRSKPAGLEAPPETDSFAETAEMRSLMKRMEEAEKLMKTEVGSADALTAKKAFVQHEAAVLGVLAKIVTQPGYGYEDDAEFKGFASGIVAATQSLKDAAEGGDFSGFEAAMSGIATNCQNCHSKYKND
ncbi:MAG: hypothetical protein RLZZ232_2885 [Planctomycetota bacterium]